MYDPLDDRGVPASRGIPRAVQIAMLVGVIAIFGMGAATLAFAGYGHVWPSVRTERINLNGSYNP